MAIITATHYGIPHERAWSIRNKLYETLKSLGFVYKSEEVGDPWQRKDGDLLWHYNK
jgi:hypothetical protein